MHVQGGGGGGLVPTVELGRRATALASHTRQPSSPATPGQGVAALCLWLEHPFSSRLRQ